MLFLLWLLSSLLWSTIPGLLNDVFIKSDSAISFSGTEKYLVVLIEMVGTVFWFIPLIVMNKTLQVHSLKLPAFVQSRTVFTFYVIGIVHLAWYLSGNQLSYPFSFLFASISPKITIIFSVFLIFTTQDNWKKIVSILIIILGLFQGGSHGPVILVGLLAIILSFRFKRYRAVSLLFSVSAVMLLSAFGNQLHYVRSLDVGKLKQLSLAEQVTALATFSGSDQESNARLFDKAIWRFGENRRVSVGFLRAIDDMGYVGMSPIKNSLVAVIPRAIWEDKPEAGSYNGDKYGKGMNVIHKYTYGNEKNMSSFYPGVHHYWEGGVLGVIFFSFLAGIFQLIMLKLLLVFGRFSEIIAISWFSIWWQMPKLWLSEVVLHASTVFLPLAIISLIFLAYDFISKRRFR